MLGRGRRRGDGRRRLRAARRSSRPVFTAMSALVLAADRPERVASLVIVNGAARALWAPDYRSRLRQPSRADPFTTVAIEPGRGRAGFRRAEASSHPSVAATIAFRAWWDAAGNRAASPSMARAVERGPGRRSRRARQAAAHHRADARAASQKRLAFVPVGHGRYLAEHIAASRYVELPGADALHWVGDSTPIARRDRGVHHRRARRLGRRTCAHHNRLHRHRRLDPARRRARATTGGMRSARQSRQRRSPRARALPRTRESTRVGDGFVAIFTSPSVAIDCADAIVDAVRPLGIEVRSGHSRGRGRGARRRHRRHGGAHRCARSRRSRGRSEVLVSSTVREIVTGSRRDVRPNAASTSSRACPVVGACTQWYVQALP